jgi:hypothetical protein
MNKILLALFVCIFTTSAFACGGSKDKEEEDKKLFEHVKTITY